MSGEKDENDGTISLPPNSTCFGTRNSIEIGRDGGDATAGMVATFYCPSQHDQESYLLVLVHDGTNTFQGCIHPSQATKVTWENFVQHNDDDNSDSTSSESRTSMDETTKIEILSNLLLKDMDRIRISYHYEDNEGIKLVIRQHMSTTDMMRFLWSQVLTPLNRTLEFGTILGTFINQNNQDIVRLQNEKKQLHDNLVNWKDTAEKLDRDWQEQKDGLLQRFLDLYQTAHSDLGQARSEISSLKRQLAEAQALASQQQPKKRPRPPEAPVYAHLPDDQDNAEFDSEMVEMLAAGKKTKLPRKVGGATKKNKRSSSGSVGAIRKNPMTGAQEVFDADAILKDPTFFGVSQEEMDGKAKKSGVTKTSSSGKSNKKADSASSDKDVVMEDATASNDNKTEPAKLKTSSHSVKDPMAFASALFANKSTSKENNKGNAGKNDSTKPAPADSAKTSKDDTKAHDDVLAAASQLFGKKD